LGQRFDLIVANILAGPLARLAPAMADHLNPRGTVVLSGLLPPHRRQVVAAYRNQGIHHRRTMIRDGWLTLILQK
jgi:ribosomal protein L11 methyltransferase